MSIAWAQGLLVVCGIYAALGLAFAVFFVCHGVHRIDTTARGMPVLARLLITPGVAALWPLMLKKWLRREQPPLA